jgi:hypothetical protein
MVFPAPGAPISRIVAAGRGDLEGPLGGRLAADVGEVHGLRNRLRHQGIQIHADRRDRALPREVVTDFR